MEDPDMPPPLMEMFINSTDTLRGRMVAQSMPPTWNDRPPLFRIESNKNRMRGWRRAPPAEEKDEDPVLLKGVRILSLILLVFCRNSCAGGPVC
jgi:hypothetical protein